MDKTWFRRLFDRTPKTQTEEAQAKADRGEAEAQFGLGLAFANRKGTTQDYLQAVQWYQKAANQDHALAQFNLGMMFAQGQGVARDDVISTMWIQKAAQQGDAGAQHRLGLRHRHAGFRGLPSDDAESRLEAYKWLRLAATQGYRGSAMALEGVTLKMSHEEVNEGNRRVNSFMPSNSKGTVT